jgi:Lambda phage tail tube protein, TTP
MSGAIPGPGFLLQVDDGTSTGPGTGHFTTVAEAKEIHALPLSVDIQDVTNQSSPGGYEEVVPTIRRSGETTFDVNFLPYDATHDSVTGLQYLLNNKIRRAFQLIIPNQAGGATMPRWTAFVTGFDITAPVAGVLGAAVKMKVTGQPTWSVPV